MSDVEEENKGKKTLSLRKVESRQIKQNFSYGRSKSVFVERKRKRVFSDKEVESQLDKVTEAKHDTKEEGVIVDGLSKNEQAARLVAINENKLRVAEEKKQSDLEAERKSEQEEADISQSSTKKRMSTEGDQKEIIPELLIPADPVVEKTKISSRGGVASEKQKNIREEKKSSISDKHNQSRRRTGKLTINDALNDEDRVRSMASMRRRREKEKRRVSSLDSKEKISHLVQLPEVITIQELANRMAERATDVVKMLMKQGMMATINDTIDTDTAELIARELGHRVHRVTEADVEDIIDTQVDDEARKERRPPIVTIMGHVSHGKTSVLDVLRKTNVVMGEAGGITQHIGAYQIVTDKGQQITFLDTPGHAVFTSMRARGAQVTDIVVLVVAGDDGVMPQTVEAIHHAKSAGVAMIVAVNKMDKPHADALRVKNDLLQYEVIAEDMGGDVIFVEISALKQEGFDPLIEAILLQAEVLELTANPNREAEGVVMDAKLEKGRGVVVTILIRRGTLKVGDVFVVGEESGRVRAILDDRGSSLEQALPTMPVEILGTQAIPSTGDIFNVVQGESKAREISEYRRRQARDNRVTARISVSLDQMFQKMKEADIQEVAVVIKTDVQGSSEVVTQTFDKMGNDEVCVNILRIAVGGITESDVILATASHAPIIGFNVRANAQARHLARKEGVEIRYYNVIYDLIDDMREALSGLLSPELRETMLGNAKILEIFTISKFGKVAGCEVVDGLMRRGSHVRLIRDDVVIHEGKLSSLRRFKDEVDEVNARQECGMAFENYANMQVNDVIECYDVEKISRSIDA